MTTNANTTTPNDSTNTNPSGDDTTPATYTPEIVAALVAAERRKVEEKVTKTAAENQARLTAEIEALRSQVDSAGKGAGFAERAALERKLEQASRQITERDSERARLEGEIRTMRVEATLGEALSSRGLTPEAQRFARLGFMADAKIDFDDKGRVQYVDLGGQTFASVDSAFESWMKTNGAAFTRDAKAPPQSLRGSRRLLDMTDDELIAEANRMRNVRR